MEPKEAVTKYYEGVLNRLDNSESDMSELDCMVYLVASVLRAIRADDFDAIFEVLLDDENLMAFIDFLETLDESDLADGFRQTQCILEDAGYLMQCNGAPIPDDLKKTLVPIRTEILSDPGMERLEEKLAGAIQGF